MDFLDKPKNKHKEASVPGTPLFGPDEGDPNWELFCFEHNIHELAQDDEEFGLVQSHRPLRGVALGLFTAMVTRIIPTSSPEAKGEGCPKALMKETT